MFLAAMAGPLAQAEQPQQPSVAAEPAAFETLEATGEVEGEAAPPLTREMVISLLTEQGLSPEEAAQQADGILAQLDFESSLDFQSGDIPLGSGLATLHVPEDFGYLSAADADRVLQAWGNPPGGGGLGMLVPLSTGLFSEQGWAVVLSYEEDGHVNDDDAEDIDYDDLLEDMQEGTEESNKDRVSAGYGAIHLDGWAEPPRYDQPNHKLYWARILRDDEGYRSLNYDVRVLGRKGVLSLSAVAGMDSLAQVKVDMERVITFAEFNDGHRYDQFDEDVDHVAAYGIGALVAGGLAAKTGLFKGLIAVLLAGKKLVVAALAAAAVGIKNLFGGGKSKGEPPQS